MQKMKKMLLKVKEMNSQLDEMKSIKHLLENFVGDDDQRGKIADGLEIRQL
jgi:hypothetical protein